MRIGLTQMDIAWEDKEKNCEICLELFEQAKSMAVDFLVFPEMTLTGFSMNAELISQGEPEFTKDFFRKATVEFDMAVAFGYAVKEDGKFYNKLAIMDRGRELSDYAKIHPFSYGDEGKYYTGGDKLAVAKLTVRKKLAENVQYIEEAGRLENKSAQDETWHIGSAICYDLRFPELFQAMSDDAELIIVPANWPEKRRMHWDTLLRARAIENQCFICGVNRLGGDSSASYEYSSALFDPWGNEFATALDDPLEREPNRFITDRIDDILVADIHPEAVKNARESFAMKQDRKKDLYKTWY